MTARVLAPLRSPRTGRQAAFLLTALPLGVVWLTALVTLWSLTLGTAITPLVIPALIGLVLVVRGGGAVETALARTLLGATISPRRPRHAEGWLRRAWQALADPWMWRTQAYLALRMTVGLVLATVLLGLSAAALFLVLAPAVYWALPEGINVGLYRVRTLPQALPLVPAGLAALLVGAWAIAPLASPWRGLAASLLGDEDTPVRKSAAPTKVSPAVETHAIVTGALVAFLIVIWALTSRGYFWPIWPILALGMPLAIHAWVGYAESHPERWRRRRLDTAFAIHAGVWAALLLFFIGVWAASGGGYFWPVWPALIAVVSLGAHLATVRSRARAAMTSRISTLEESRAGAVDVQDAELRRIERDLHDGAQARLVALGMSLGMAEQKLDSDPESARELLADARAGAGDALKELRALARGIHPPVLADRGLDAAVRALAAASPLAVTVSVLPGERPRAPVESAAYFVVAEALANAGKHATATRIDVRIARVGDELSVEIHDDGRGGADPDGSGLSGLRRRVEALDGTLTVVSPAGGPTTIRAELPCE